MKAFRIIGRSIKNAGKSIFRNFSLSMASIVCTIITLVLVSIGMLLSYNVNNITKDILKELTIVVFMDKDTSKEELDKTLDSLKKIDNVKNVVYDSKDDIKSRMASESELYAKIIDTWEDGVNPLQDSYVIEVDNVEEINETVTTIKNLDKVDTVKYGESMVGELVKIFNIIKKGTIVLVAGLVLVTTFLINNTIKITIFSRKREIDIMRLVGTSNIVIKLPFLIEGFFIGLIGSSVPICLTVFGYNYAYNELNTNGLSNVLNIVKLCAPDDIVFKVSFMLLLIGTVVGMLASVKAVRKHLTI